MKTTSGGICKKPTNVGTVIFFNIKPLARNQLFHYYTYNTNPVTQYKAKQYIHLLTSCQAQGPTNNDQYNNLSYLPLNLLIFLVNEKNLRWPNRLKGTKSLFKHVEERSIACDCADEEKVNFEGFAENGCYSNQPHPFQVLISSIDANSSCSVS